MLLKRIKKLLRKKQKEKRRLDWHDYTVSALYKFDKKVLVSYDDKSFGQQKLEIISEIFKIIKDLPDPLNEKLNNITLNSVYNDLLNVFTENNNH